MIRYKGIEHERLEDAPFVGALICANHCGFGCGGCFNQHLQALPTLEDTPEEIINQVKSNPFNRGIILGGLEWTEQVEEMISLVEEAQKNDLEVMIYTGIETVGEFWEVIGGSWRIIGPYYLKVGRYDGELPGGGSEFGVKLASENQDIYKIY